ncbi:MAG: thioesterase family protein [Acidimicrobiales bacterium]
MNDSFDPTGTSWCGVSFETDPPAIAVRERVRLADTDSSGLIYYGAVTPWLSRAHAELVLALGFRQTSLVPTPMLPVVNVELTYHDRLALGDAYVLRGWVERTGTSSVTMAYEVRRDGTLCVSGRMTHVHLDEATMRPAPLPGALVAAARHRGGSGATQPAGG